jgi:hypothetical protein
MIRAPRHRTTTLRRIGLAAAFVSLVSIATGCFSYRAANAPPPPSEPIPVNAFAPRSTAEQAGELERFAGELERRPLAVFAFDTEDPNFRRRYADRVERNTVSVESIRRTNDGLLVRVTPRVMTGLEDEELEIVGGDPLIRTGFFSDKAIIVTPTAYYLSASRLDRLEATEALVAQERESLDQPRLDTPPAGLRYTRDRRLAARLREGIAVNTPADVPEDAVGTVVYLPALFANVYEYALIDELRDRGWAMLFIDASPRATGPREPEREAVQERRSVLFVDRFMHAQREASRRAIEGEPPSETRPFGLTESITRELERDHPLPQTGFEWSPDRDTEELAAALASAVDAAMLEHTDAAAAAFGELLEREPHLARKPVAVVGFSGGSLIAPAVAARLLADFHVNDAALVLVGGGGDVLSISLDSTLTDGGLNVAPSDAPLPEGARAELVAAYRARAALDPLSIMPALREVPLLKVYANEDRTVPTSAALELASAHGGADRLIFNGKHMPLFYFLPGQKDRIANWIERRLLPRD